MTGKRSNILDQFPKKSKILILSDKFFRVYELISVGERFERAFNVNADILSLVVSQDSESST
jgi:hypothetical protein